MAEPLPPGLNAQRMADALERFRKIVGSEWVFSGEKVSSYYDPYTIPNDPDRYKAHAAVAPASTEQVQEIVKVANELRVQTVLTFMNMSKFVHKRKPKPVHSVIAE